MVFDILEPERGHHALLAALTVRLSPSGKVQLLTYRTILGGKIDIPLFSHCTEIRAQPTGQVGNNGLDGAHDVFARGERLLQVQLHSVSQSMRDPWEKGAIGMPV